MTDYDVSFTWKDEGLAKTAVEHIIREQFPEAENIDVAEVVESESA